ncbi:GUN4-like [Musa troglodytarum]|uniref:GUN4-like n=1 Tax=Musa troglodytarum TaxID=320322 RepID=A0A9E7KWN9_9LILI|nr:GUN4-like [Musa troglodytarum]
MATSSLQSLHQSFHHHHFTASPDSIFFKPTKSFKLFSNLSPSSSSLTTTSVSSVAPATAGAAAAATPFDVLARHLSSSDFRQADEETRRLLIALAGEAAQKRGMGWMKRLDTEVEQFGYRSFPGEFLWELKDDTPEGHLPLTNALRGTQLLRSILTHPAFEESEAEEGEEQSEEGGGTGKEEEKKPKLKDARRSLKPDYSF